MISISANIGSNDDDGREPENVLEIANTESLDGVPRQHRERELDLLIDRLEEDQIGHVKPTVEHIKKVVEKLKHNKRLPHTFGIFGGWGTGKTFILTSLAKTLREENCKVIYFNAFTYASFTDLTTSLVYRILRAANADDGALKLLHQVNGISRSHFKGFYKSLVMPAKAIRATREIIPNVHSDRQLKIAGKYLGKVERIHQELVKSLESNGDDPIYVLIDELDRCDPEEAFGVIKQLRVLLNVPKLPLFFILGINPEPIGRALQKKYGLDGHDSYDSLSILEKFVDSSMQLPPQRNIGKLIEFRLQELNITPAKFYPSVLKLQSRNGQRPYLPPGIANLPVFSNLRQITKTLEMMSYNPPPNNQYSHWVWELLQVANPHLASSARKLADELEEITDKTLGHLAVQIRLETSRYHTQYGSSSSNLFDFYYELFKDQMTNMAHKRLKAEQGGQAGIGNLLSELVSSTVNVYSLAHLCCINVGDLETKNFQSQGSDLRYSEMVPTQKAPFLELERMLLPSGNL